MDSRQIPLSRDGHHRCMVHRRAGQRGRKMGGGRAGTGQADARPPGEPAIDIGHVSRSRLGPGRHQAYPGLRKRLHQVQRFHPRYAEYHLDPLPLQTLDKQVTCLHSSPHLHTEVQTIQKDTDLQTSGLQVQSISKMASTWRNLSLRWRPPGRWTPSAMRGVVHLPDGLHLVSGAVHLRARPRSG